MQNFKVKGLSARPHWGHSKHANKPLSSFLTSSLRQGLEPAQNGIPPKIQTMALFLPIYKILHYLQETLTKPQNYPNNFQDHFGKP